MNGDREELLTAKELAQMMKVHRCTLCRLHRAGKVPSPLIVGKTAQRWVRIEVQAWIAAGMPDRQTWDRVKGMIHG